MNVCVQCARSSRKGCCWADPDTRDVQSFGISVADVLRIVKATKRKPSEFLDVGRVSSELREQISMGYPDLFRVMKGNIRLSLKSDSEGWCKLLGPQGCTLSKEDRPRVCSTYPAHYEMRVNNRVLVKSDALADSSGCLALKKACGSPNRLYRLLLTSERETRSLAEKMHDEAEAHSLLSVSEIVSKVDALERS